MILAEGMTRRYRRPPNSSPIWNNQAPAAPRPSATATWSGASGANGEPLVLLHGGTGSWMHWVRNIEDLSRDYMLLVPDIPGSGESAAPQHADHGGERCRGAARRHRQILGPDRRFSIAAFSMGGFISGYVAKLAGARVHVPGAGRPERHHRAARPTAADILAAAADRRGEARGAPAQSRAPDVLRPRQGRRSRRPYPGAQCRALARARQAHQSHRRSEKSLPGFQGRLASIWGEHDVTAVPYFAGRREKLEQFRPGATFDVIPGVGHWVQYEAPDAFNALLRARLKPQWPQAPIRSAAAGWPRRRRPRTRRSPAPSGDAAPPRSVSSRRPNTTASAMALWIANSPMK